MIALQTPTLILIRGIPGSGKSSFASFLNLVSNRHIVHLEADMFFTSPEGTYKYVKEQINEAHKWCCERAEVLLIGGAIVAVSNTFTRNWEMKPYIEAAERTNAQLIVLRCEQQFTSVHSVPADVLERMKQRFEPYEC